MLNIHIKLFSLGNAITSRRIYSTLFLRVTVLILLTAGLLGFLDTELGVYNGLFH
jgi:hypothetical protein